MAIQAIGDDFLWSVFIVNWVKQLTTFSSLEVASMKKSGHRQGTLPNLIAKCQLTIGVPIWCLASIKSPRISSQLRCIKLRQRVRTWDGQACLTLFIRGMVYLMARLH